MAFARVILPNMLYRFCTAAMLHGRNNENVLHLIERTFVPMGKRIYCSCHATWPPCKTSIVDITEAIQRNMEQRLVTCSIFIDLKKAINT